MSQHPKPMRVEQVKWTHVFPWLRLFNSFRMAIQPSKLFLALLLVILVYLGGRTLDAVWGPRALPQEIGHYRVAPWGQFTQWRTLKQKNIELELIHVVSQLPDGLKKTKQAKASPTQYRDARRMVNVYFDQQQGHVREFAKNAQSDPHKIQQRLLQLNERRQYKLNQITAIEPLGVFDTALRFTIEAFNRLVGSATSLQFGFGEFLRSSQANPHTVVGALRDILVVMPGWMLAAHQSFALIFGLLSLCLLAILGGAIARMAALDATGETIASPLHAIGFALNRFGWFLVTPLFPLILIAVVGLLMMLGGFTFFNLPVLDMAGGLFFVVALVGGFIIALLLILLAVGGHLFFPSLAIEGTDAFDAVSRSFGYVVGRPWQWLCYSLISLVYGAVTYIFVGMLIFLTLWVTHYFVSFGVVAHTATGANQFVAMMPAPELGQLMYKVDWHNGLGFTGKVASGLIWVWVLLLICMLGAFSISFYLSANTWIYLLLRQAADGTELDEIVEDTSEIQWRRTNKKERETPNKVESPEAKTSSSKSPSVATPDVTTPTQTPTDNTSSGNAPTDKRSPDNASPDEADSN